LFAWFTTCSKTSIIRNGMANSITGRLPARAAPVAKLVKPCSDSGMSTTRRGPKRAARPAVTFVMATSTSSPMTKTPGSRSISSPSARLSAFR
jgi:hypothetical protein